MKIFQKRFLRTKFDIYVFIFLYHSTDAICNFSYFIQFILAIICFITNTYTIVHTHTYIFFGTNVGETNGRMH